MTDTTTNIHDILISQFEASPFQPRRNFAPDEMDELTASIREHGVLQPVVVRPIKKGKQTIYQLVAGERRWRAAQMAGLTTLPANVRSMSDLESALIALIENGQREDVDDWGTALAMKRLMEESEKAGEPLSERGLARKLNKSIGYVRNFLGLFKLPEDVQEMVQRNESVRSAAFEIARVDDVTTRETLIEAVDAGASFQVVKKSVDKVLADEEWKKESRAPDRDSKEAQARRTAREREARQEVSTALDEMNSRTRHIAAWWEHLSADDQHQCAEQLQQTLSKAQAVITGSTQDE